MVCEVMIVTVEWQSLVEMLQCPNYFVLVPVFDECHLRDCSNLKTHQQQNHISSD